MIHMSLMRAPVPSLRRKCDSSEIFFRNSLMDLGNMYEWRDNSVATEFYPQVPFATLRSRPSQ